MIYQALVELEKNNQAAAFCVVVRSRGSTPRRASSKMLVYPDGRILGTVGGGELENRVIAEAQAALLDGKPRLLDYNMVDPQRGDVGTCGGQVEVFVEPVLPKPVLVVIGCGHVGKALTWLAKWLGFQVIANDDRPELCNPHALPGADGYYTCPMQQLPGEYEITPWSYLVLTTRGTDFDVQGLPALLETEAAYIGVIGSQRRWKMTTKRLLESGIAPEKLARIHSPVGLELNAETPEEIAVSIMAEIIRLRNGGDGEPMKAQTSPAARQSLKELTES